MMTHAAYDCDVLVIGGGIVGLSTAYALQRAAPGTRVTVLEKEHGPARHQTGRNSGVIHSGIYYRPGSLKARYALRGSAELADFCAEHGIAHATTGKLIVATERSELPRLHGVSALLRDRRLGRAYLHRFTHEEFGRTPPPAAHEPFTTLNGQGLLDLEAPDHPRIRRLVCKAFTPRTVENLAPTVRRLAAGLVDAFVAKGGGDLLAEVAEPLPVAVIAEMLGVPEEDRVPLRPWSAAICGMYELNPSEETAAAAVRASEVFPRICAG
ncbi:L-2-hydroxyglutarate dehydrogenase [Streptomyces microflavus]